MLEAILNLAGLVLMITVACHTIVLHRRLTRLRGALAEAGTVLPSLDASVGRMSEVVNGFAQRLQTDLTAVESRCLRPSGCSRAGLGQSFGGRGVGRSRSPVAATQADGRHASSPNSARVRGAEGVRRTCRLAENYAA